MRKNIYRPTVKCLSLLLNKNIFTNELELTNLTNFEGLSYKIGPVDWFI